MHTRLSVFSYRNVLLTPWTAHTLFNQIDATSTIKRITSSSLSRRCIYTTEAFSKLFFFSVLFFVDRSGLNFAYTA